MKRRDASRLAAVALGVCVIAVVWADILASVAAQRAEALRGAALNVENLAQAFEENIVRTFSSLDQSLRSLRRAYAEKSSGFDINGWATTTTALTEMDVHFAVTDKDGIVTAGTLTAPGERLDLSTRPHFLAERKTPDDDLYISKPTIGQSSQEKVIIVARKLLSDDRGFNGIVFGSLNLEYLTTGSSGSSVWMALCGFAPAPIPPTTMPRSARPARRRICWRTSPRRLPARLSDPARPTVSGESLPTARRGAFRSSCRPASTSLRPWRDSTKKLATSISWAGW
jgi:hypothetical protein